MKRAVYILLLMTALCGVDARGCEKIFFDANLRWKLGNHEAKLSFYNEAIVKNPADPVLYLERGILCSQLDEYDKAHEDLNRAIALNPRFADAYFYRGWLRDNYVLNIGGEPRYDEKGALEDANRAIELEKLKSRYSLSDAFYLRGSVQENKFMSYDNALKDYNASIESNRKNGWAYYHRASLCFFHLGSKPDRAVRI